jgi:hypothetical protein
MESVDFFVVIRGPARHIVNGRCYFCFAKNGKIMYDRKS